jgi:hypothetical protein
MNTRKVIAIRMKERLDMKGKSWHAYDWGSDDGVNHSKSHNKITAWLHEAQVPKVAMEIKRGPYKAWQKVKDIPGALKFLGGKSSAPKNTTGTKCYTMSYEQSTSGIRFNEAKIPCSSPGDGSGHSGRRASDAGDLERPAAAGASDCGSSIPKG